VNKILNIKKNDVKFKVAVTKNDKIFWSQFVKHKWEDNFFKTFEIIKNIKDYLFLDVGASNGCMSLYASNFCKKIISLEPEINAYLSLKRNITLNKARITPLKLALNLKNKTTLSKSGTDFSSIVFNESYKIRPIATISFSKLIKKYIKNNKFFMKIDIEGYEFSLLKDKVFQKIIYNKKPPIYLAIHLGFGPLYKYKEAPFNFLNRFYNLDKTIFEYILLNRLLKNYSNIEIEGKKVSRFFYLNLKYYRKDLNIFMYNL
jgi:FkbM family methyltransferase